MAHEPRNLGPRTPEPRTPELGTSDPRTPEPPIFGLFDIFRAIDQRFSPFQTSSAVSNKSMKSFQEALKNPTKWEDAVQQDIDALGSKCDVIDPIWYIAHLLSCKIRHVFSHESGHVFSCQRTFFSQEKTCLFVPESR